MKTITFMEMVELSYSEEYKEWLRKNVYPSTLAYEDLIRFEDFLEEKEYKIAI